MDWSSAPAVQETNVQSAICEPAPGTEVEGPLDEIEVRPHAAWIAAAHGRSGEPASNTRGQREQALNACVEAAAHKETGMCTTVGHATQVREVMCSHAVSCCR